MIDLHMHSTMSDGSLSPEALAGACAKADLTAAALTDHDTLAGTRRFLRACEAAGLTGIAGVELSAEFGPGTMHLLGYVPEAAIDPLQAALLRVQESRGERNDQILAALDGLGCHVPQEEVLAIAGDGVVGRPHIAAIMQRHGYVSSREEAFRRYLGKGCPAYRDRYRLSSNACISLLHEHGGVAVLAHPFTLQVSASRLAHLLDDLVADGLDGVEVLYPEHHLERRRLFGRLAQKRGLLETGGSDFHGDLNPAISLGRGFGCLVVPDSMRDALMSRMMGQQARSVVKEEHGW